jgi:hypothetical protein
MRLGKKKWRHHVEEVVKQLKTALQADYVVLGGGNAKRLKKPPPGSSLGENSNAFRGGYRLWTESDKGQRASAAPDQRKKSVVVNTPVKAKVIFLFDVDNTLLDNDQVTDDLERVGPVGRRGGGVDRLREVVEQTAGAWADNPLWKTSEDVLDWVRALRAEDRDPWAGHR